LDGDDLRVITDSEVLALLVERVGADHLAWIKGESGGYEFADEQSTILGAFGGVAVGASVATRGQRRAVAQFESGTGSVEMINGGVSGDVAWLVLIERAHINFVGHGTAPPWAPARAQLDDRDRLSAEEIEWWGWPVRSCVEREDAIHDRCHDDGAVL